MFNDVYLIGLFVFIDVTNTNNDNVVLEISRQFLNTKNIEKLFWGKNEIKI